MIGRPTPIAVLPVGTANNIATTLDIKGPIEAIVDGWKSSRPIRFDVGSVSGTDGKHRFFESFGGGLFAELIHHAAKHDDSDKAEADSATEAVRRAVGRMRETLEKHTTDKWKVKLDGKDRSGHFLLVEVMNIQCIGPNLHLAPGADVSDGWFDVVLLNESHREELDRHLEHRETEETGWPGIETVRAREIELIPAASARLHSDDRLVKRDGDEPIRVKMAKESLTFLAPGG
jgi:diacylglycerol kinase family enzyme